MYDETKDEEVDIAGSLLLAHPHLTDANFKHSVVLMTAHNDEGSVGVVLNRNLDLTLKDVNSEFSDYGLEDVPLYYGGPVNDSQILLAAWELLEESNEFKIYFGLPLEEAQKHAESGKRMVIRAFRGYSGWTSGQLKEELEANAWVVADMDGAAICELGGPELWKHIIMGVNPELGLLSFAPEAPEEN